MECAVPNLAGQVRSLPFCLFSQALLARSLLVASNCLLLLIRIMFCITTRTNRAKEMKIEIRRAADDIKALLLLQQQIVEGTKFHLA